MSSMKRKRKIYILIVENTSNDDETQNSGKTWYVRLSDNPSAIIFLPRNEAEKLITSETKYNIESFGSVYRFKKCENLVNIKYKGFKKPEVSNANSIKDLIKLRREENFKKLKQ